MSIVDRPAIVAQSLGKMYKLYLRPMDKMLEAFGVNRLLFRRKNYYQEFWALRNVDLEVKRGERLGIVGPNGAGKSTLLKIIAGNTAPSEGAIEVNGKIQALMELGTGFHPEFTGLQNIRSSLAYQGLSSAQIRQKEEEIVDFAELEEFIDQPVKTYSAGMYARLAFAVATSIEPEILIVDEVLGAGDAYFAGKSVERMKMLTQESNATVLFVSHDVGSVQKLCTRVIWIEKGRILMAGKPHEVVTAYINSMRRETEIRHRAREMNLTKKQARTIIVSSQDTYTTRLLFRFRTDTPHPIRKHIIRRITLSNSTGPLAHIEIGEAMDNLVSQSSYIMDDIVNTDWTPPTRIGDQLVRYYADCGGKDCHAPFVLSVPSYLLNPSDCFDLRIVHSETAGEAIYVEMWDGKKYIPLGMLARGQASHTSESVFRVQRDETDTFVPFAELKNEEQEIPDSRTPEMDEAPESNASTESGQLRITGVDFILKNNRSARVVPLGSYLRVEISYEAFEPIQDPVFAVTFNGLDGTQMDHKNNRVLNVKIGEVYGKGKASFVFDPFRLGVGDYLVTVAVLKYLDLDHWYDVPPSYDRHERRYALSVYTETAHGKNLGLIFQECSFIHSEEFEQPVTQSIKASVTRHKF